jgi:hypothetical protein
MNPLETLSVDLRRAAAAAVAILFVYTLAASFVSTPSPARSRPQQVAGPAREPARSPALSPRRSERVVQPTGDLDLVAYEGLGSWVDLFNRGPWRDPVSTVRRMKRQGVRTIYLQTATYGSPSAIVHPTKLARFITAAHARDMYVVGWSVPSFAKAWKDFWRARSAISFRTRSGDRLDSFALDIEADIVRSIWRRNHRLLVLSRRLRTLAGPSHELGAIVPDPAHNKYWPNFPYKRIANLYDVMVPMGYFTFRTWGFANVRDYTAANISYIRRKTRNPKTPIHVIGGIADDVGVPAARGFVSAITDKNVLGASLYDFPITSQNCWGELSKIRRLGN